MTMDDIIEIGVISLMDRTIVIAINLTTRKLSVEGENVSLNTDDKVIAVVYPLTHDQRQCDQDAMVVGIIEDEKAIADRLWSGLEGLVQRIPRYEAALGVLGIDVEVGAAMEREMGTPAVYSTDGIQSNDPDIGMPDRVAVYANGKAVAIRSYYEQREYDSIAALEAAYQFDLDDAGLPINTDTEVSS